MADIRPLSHVVVVGSSAGGIDALSVLVSTLKEGFAAPIVIAQHLEPTRPSHLGNILARRSKLPVHAIAGRVVLEPGTIYVVPSNHHVRVIGQELDVIEDGQDGRPIPSIDLLFSSAAEAYGEQTIGVILTGTGSDGAAGAYNVKKAGGTVIIQDPETASYPGMPLSLAPTTVDIVARLDRIGPILRDLINGSTVPSRPDDKRTLEQFLAEVRERSGLDFSSYRMPTIMRRLQRRIVATNSGDLPGYLQYVNEHPGEYQQLVNAFLIKVTEFFRDPDVFTYLRERVLPELIAYSRKHGNELRVWSAGCATGEEAYSLAILVCEALGPSLEHFNVRIFATDADADAISYARRGVYPAAALDRMPEELVTKYFTQDGGSYTVRKNIRLLTVFGQHDLGQRAPFPHTDLVMCRNVLIYFTSELQQHTLQLFAYSLRNNGYLVLGRSETPSQLGSYFVSQDKVHKVFRRQGDRILLPPARLREAAPPPFQGQSLGRHMVRTTPVATSTTERPRMRANTDLLLLKLPVGVVVVDRRYDIQAINSAARDFLSIHGQATGEDLIHIAHGVPTDRLRAAIDTALRDGTTTGIDEFALDEPIPGNLRYLQITCHPQRLDGDDGPYDSVMVVIHDVTALAQARRGAEQQLQSTTATLEHVKEEAQHEAARRELLIERLVESNRELLQANQELTSANEDLRTANEEFLLNNEETQAAIEEVETLNEELQATNEELETLNEELQATNEELNTTNDDLHARGLELQELARTADEERARLSAILVSMGDAVLLVDRAGRPVLTNSAFKRIFGDAGVRFTPLDERGLPLPENDRPQRRAARGESFNMEFLVIDKQGEQRWYEANGHPVSSGEQGQFGGIVVIRDITERNLTHQREQFLALAGHELRTPLTPLLTALQSLQRSLGQNPADEGQRHLIEISLAQTQRLTKLVDDLLDASRLQTGKYTLKSDRVRLDELVTRIVESARLVAPQMELTLTTDGAKIVVEGDADRLEQVVWNLINNAIKHASESDRIDVHLRMADGGAALQVRDFGPGIAPSDQQRIFSRFYQSSRALPTTERGLGLGLYIAREIAQAHGGSLTVQSVLGQGATFTLSLPVLPK
jgi:two-component system CheB/CheR fusion protein